jgi:HD-GYP domain-containing protein (c-di-GMP phosphodiesterase class II)
MKTNAKSRRETALAGHGEQETKSRLGLLCEVGKRVGSVSHLSRMVKQVTQMTQHTLNASASSVLLFDDNERELVFEVAEGQAGKVLKQIRISAESGIAGWVARKGKPLIVNDVSQDPRFSRGVDELTTFVTESIICAPLIVQHKVIGVIEVLNKVDGSDFSEQDLDTLVSVASTAAMALENAKLHQVALDAYKSTIKALAATIDAKDPYTSGHSQRVTEYATMAATSLSLPQEEIEVIEYAGILHDIGKIGVSDSILNKPGSLTVDEWAIIRRHPLIGSNMLRDIPYLDKARNLILHHHERYDGKGYPHGLKGEDIPLGARLIAVADAFDTMTTDRSYRNALSKEYAISELYKCTGTQFCPIAVAAFVSGLRTNTENLSLSSVTKPEEMTGKR